MIDVTNPVNCCGCGACAQICPHNCIAMQRDKEGFLYPAVQESGCVQCGLCESVCPIVQNEKEVPREQTAYLVQHKDETIRKESTSGGAFTAIAAKVIEKGGVVFGAAFDAAWNVKHRYVEQIADLSLFRGSKYVQSELGDSFKLVKQFLDAGRYVCFSGTPCQVEGVLAFLKKPYDKLLTVDTVCRAVPSPLIWEKYLQIHKSRHGIYRVGFRDKASYGYDYSQMMLTYDDGTHAQQGIDSDQYLRAFFSNICDRPSCYACRFKKRYRQSDITIWDCFDARTFDRSFHDNKGTTRVLTHSPKGKAWMEGIEDSVRYKRIDPAAAVHGAREMLQSVPMNPKRAQFFEDAVAMEPRAFFDRYFPIGVRQRAERLLRIVLVKMGIGQEVKSTIKRLIQYER